jgi:hypothetical protein
MLKMPSLAVSAIPYSQNIEYPFIANYQVCEERDHLQVLHHQAASIAQIWLYSAPTKPHDHIYLPKQTTSV